ncbi:MAG: ribonuclease HI [Desulfotalea sp.]
MAAKKKFYAVAVGNKPGIYLDWGNTQKQVIGFKGAIYKSFPTKDEADAFMANPVYEQKKAKKIKGKNDSKEMYPGVQLPNKGNSEEIIIYTDGACSGNPGPGGYGAVVLDGDERYELSAGYVRTTNNRMEMLAVIVALESIVSIKPIKVYSDSSYVINAITKGWAKGWQKRGWVKSDGEPAKNPDLWQRMLDVCSNKKISYIWVKGHAGHELNEVCDRLAVKASVRGDLLVDAGNGAI